MLYFLEEAGNWSNNWNYTFLIVALIAIMIGTYLTISKIIKGNEDNSKNHIKSVYHDKNGIKDSETILKKKKAK